MPDAPKPTGEIVLYRTEDGQTRVECRFADQNIWLTQVLLAELFQTTVPNVNIHIGNILREAELTAEATIKDYLIVRQEGSRQVRRPVKHYSLEMILAVGYRVQSPRGTQFRQWATRRLQEYLLKGFALDDERLKQMDGGSYFDELLARIRDIRSSEKVFWRKVLDIYATSIDYDPNVEASLQFFATVQNKIHWGAHGHTAAEIIRARADAGTHNIGFMPGGRFQVLDNELVRGATRIGCNGRHVANKRSERVGLNHEWYQGPVMLGSVFRNNCARPEAAGSSVTIGSSHPGVSPVADVIIEHNTVPKIRIEKNNRDIVIRDNPGAVLEKQK
jgi:hypothetical protein